MHNFNPDINSITGIRIIRRFVSALVWININFHYHTCFFLHSWFVFSSFLCSHFVFSLSFCLGVLLWNEPLVLSNHIFALKLIANIKELIITQCMYNNNNNSNNNYYLLDSSSFWLLENCCVLWQDLFYEGGSCLWGIRVPSSVTFHMTLFVTTHSCPVEKIKEDGG